jgi:glycosyltransferase 2 family protein
MTGKKKKKTIRARFNQGLAITLAIGAAVYAGFAIRSEWSETADALGAFAWKLLPVLLLLSLGNYLLRFIRWEIYLRMLDIRVPLGASLSIFLAGLAMTITPGKVGEFLKSYLLREGHGIPMATSAPVVFVERVGDLLGLILLASFGVAAYRPDTIPILVIASLVCVAAIVVLQSARLTGLALAVVRKLPAGDKVAPKVAEMVEASRALLGARALIIGLVLATAAWFCECAGYWLAFSGFDVAAFELGLATFGYSISTLAGVVSPGGIGVTDAGLIEIAEQLRGIEPAVSTAASFIVRVCTLWFAVGLGAIALLRFRGLTDVDVDEVRGIAAEPADG